MENQIEQLVDSIFSQQQFLLKNHPLSDYYLSTVIYADAQGDYNCPEPEENQINVEYQYKDMMGNIKYYIEQFAIDFNVSEYDSIIKNLIKNKEYLAEMESTTDYYGGYDKTAIIGIKMDKFLSLFNQPEDADQFKNYYREKLKETEQIEYNQAMVRAINTHITTKKEERNELIDEFKKFNKKQNLHLKVLIKEQRELEQTLANLTLSIEKIKKNTETVNAKKQEKIEHVENDINQLKEKMDNFTQDTIEKSSKKLKM